MAKLIVEPSPWIQWEDWRKKFAWFPTLVSGKRTWWTYYYRRYGDSWYKQHGEHGAEFQGQQRWKQNGTLIDVLKS